ncbi:MAG TPA: inositol monophosphatase family protein [Candidatus Limnocylindria bacterium]|jgi:myo-inositol-1(or 4)-monophosphatase|nr:inositol monophosphatase family protein [Candidatus Limnocylindria bacterium]
MSGLEPASALALATGAAREAGALLLELRRRPPAGVRSKSSATDLVSDADERAERAIVTRIRAERADDAIVAEEGSEVSGGSGISWYVDPLDGTINYLYGIPHWSVAICCADERGPLAGVVYDPLRDELFSAAAGQGARLGDRRLAVSDQRNLAAALVATGFGYSAAQRRTQGRIIAGVLGEVRDIRRFGSAALDLAWVAAGRFDGFFESVDKPWDWLAGALLVREAGGRVTELAPMDPALPRVIASGAGIHDALVALLARATASL